MSSTMGNFYVGVSGLQSSQYALNILRLVRISRVWEPELRM